MSRLLAPNDAMQGVDVVRSDGSMSRYGYGAEPGHGRHGAIVEPRSVADARSLRDQGFTPASLGGVQTGVGRRCAACGFGSFFLTCSRCGGECRREEG